MNSPNEKPDKFLNIFWHNVLLSYIYHVEKKNYNEQNLEACFIRIFTSKYEESRNNRNDMVQIFLGKCRNLLSSEQTDFKAI